MARKRQGVTLLDGPLANYLSRQKMLKYMVFWILGVCRELRVITCVCIAFEMVSCYDFIKLEVVYI